MKTTRNPLPVFHLRPVAAAVLFALTGHAAAQLPSGANVVAGQASISQSATRQVITQTTDKAIINWNSFSIGSGQGVIFLQPGSGSVALNRVVGSDPSSIFGSLSANGQIFLVNPNGVFFGRGAVLDTAGLVATTLDIRNDDFLAGRYTFNRAANAQDGASIINEGLLRARDGGYVLLAGDRAENRAGGVIEARLGTVALAAGGRMTLDMQGDRLVNFTVDEATAHRLGGVSNLGQIAADGGRVVMSAMVAREAAGAVVNAGGSIRAAGIEEKDGEIILTGGSGEVQVSGNLDVTGKRGGRIQVSGERIGLQATANLDASGRLGGGTVLVGGDAHGATAGAPNAKLTTVAAGARIRADATENGDGGKVVVWSDDTTRFAGQISARGGANGGNGGFVEVSGKRNLSFDGNVDTSAPRGKSGTLLLDPATITITDGASGSGAEDTQLDADQPTAGNPVGEVVAADGGAVGFTISRGKLESLNATTNIVLEATGQITINDMAANLVNLQTGAGNSFTLRSTTTGGITFLDANDEIRTAGGAINLRAEGTGSISNLGKLTSNNGDISLFANATALAIGKNISAGTGTVSLEAAGISQTTGVITADKLLVKGSGSFTLGTPAAVVANTVSTIAADVTGSFSFTNVNSGSGPDRTLSVGSVSGINGIQSHGGDITVYSDSTAGLSINQAVTTGSASTGTIKLRAAELLTTGTATQPLSINAAVTGGGIVLDGADEIVQTAAGVLSTGFLAVRYAAGSNPNSVDLAQANNQVDRISATVSGSGSGAGNSFSFRNAAGKALQIGTVDGLNGIDSKGGTISIAADSLDIAQQLKADGDANGLVYLATAANNRAIRLGSENSSAALILTQTELDRVKTGTSGLLRIGTSANTGNMTLASNIASNATTWSTLSLKTGGTVTQSAGALTVANLAVEALGSGALSLTNNSTAAGTAALKSNGALSYTYGSGALADLTVTTLDGVIGLSSQNGNIAVTAARTLNLTQSVNAGAGTISLSANGAGISQSGGALTATGLKLTGSGTFSFDQSGNQVGTLAANATGGTLSLTDAGLLTVGAVSGTTGITTGGASVTLTADRMAVTQDITTAGGGITLKPLTTTQKMDLGSMVDSTANTLELSAAEIARLKSGAGGLTFGNAAINGQILVSAAVSATAPLSLANGTGGVQINSTLATTSGSGITLNSGGAISDAGGTSGVSAPTLNATAAGGISLTGSANAISTLYLTNVGGNINVVDHKASLALNSVSQTGGGSVSVSNTGTLAVTAAPITTDGGNLSLSSGGAMTLLQDLTAPGAEIALNATSGGVNQTAGVITASALKLTGSGAFNLANFKTSVAGAVTTYLYNNVATLAADITGALTYRDKDALTVGTVGAVSGINTHGGALSLTTGGTNTTGGGPTTYNAGDITLTQSVSSGAGTTTLKADRTGAVNQTGGSLTAGALTVTSGGVVTLDQAGNDVSSVSITANGAVAFQDANTVTVGGTGIVSGNANIDITTGGLLTLSKTVNAGGGTVTIASGGGVTQSGGGVVGNALRLTGTGNFVLNQVSTDPSSGGSNNVVTLAANVTGSLNYLDANALTIGTVGGVSGITSSGGGDIDVRTHAGSLTVNQEVASAGSAATRGDVSLIAGGSGSTLTLNQNVRGDQVRLNSEGTMVQNAPGCGAPPCPGNASYVEAETLYLGSQNNPDTAIWNRSTNSLGEIVRYFTGATVLNENLNANKLIIWGVDGAISFSLGAGFGISTGDLLLGGKGSFYLENAGNDITTLAVARPWGSNSGYNVRYADVDGFTLGTVTWNALLSSSSSVGTWTWSGTKSFSGVNNNGMWGSVLGEFGGTGGEVKLTAGGVANTINLSKNIATGGQVLLTSPGGLSEATGVTISGSNLKVVANGAVNLGNTNSVTGFAAQVTNGDITLVTSQNLAIGTVDGISGVTLTNNGEATVDIRSTAGSVSVNQPISVVTNGGVADNAAPAHIKLRSYRNLNIASSLTARGGTAGTGVGAEVVLRADRGGIFHTGGSINAFDDGPVTAASSAPHQGKITVRAGADYLDAGSDIWGCAWNFSDCGKVTLSTLAATSTNGSAIIDVFAPNGLTGNGSITATGKTAPRIRLTGDIQNSSDSLVSSRSIVLNGAVTVQQTAAADANKKLDSETAGLLISGYDITTWGALASNSMYGVSISAQRNISLAANLSTTANDGVSLSTGDANGTVKTFFGARVTAKQLGLTGDRDKGIFNLATDIGTLQVLGAKALTIDNSVHTGMLLATVVGRVSEATTDPNSGQTVPAVDKPVGAISITTGGDLTIFSLNNQSTQSYDLAGNTNWAFFGLPADPRPLTLIANNIIETPGAFTLDANTHVTLRPFDASRPIVVKKQPGMSTDPNTTYYYGGVMGLLNQFNPDVWLTIGGPGYNGNITVGSQTAGNWPSSEQFSLARMSVAFETTGRVYNMFAADTNLPTMWTLLTSPGTPVPPINCAIGQACIAKISSNEVIIKDSYTGSRYVRIAGQGDGSGGFTPPTGGGGSTGSGDGGGSSSSSSSSSGTDSTSSTDPAGDPGGGGASGTPGETVTTVVVTTTPDTGTTIADSTDPTTSTTPSDPLGPTDLAPDGGSGSTGSSLAGVDSKTGGESTDPTDTTGTTLAGDPGTTPPGTETPGTETGTPGDTTTTDTTTLVGDDTGTDTTGTTLAGDPGGTTPGGGTPGDGSDTTTTAGTSSTDGTGPGTLAGDDGSTTSTGTTLAGDTGGSTTGDTGLSGDGGTSTADAGGPGGDGFSGSGDSDGTGTTLAGDPGSSASGSGLAGDGTGSSGDGSGDGTGSGSGTSLAGGGTEGGGTSLAGDGGGSASGAGGSSSDGSGSSLAGDGSSSGAGTTLAGDGAGGASEGSASGGDSLAGDGAGSSSGTSLAGDGSGSSSGTGLAGDGGGSTSLADAGDFAGGGSTSGGGTGDGAGGGDLSTGGTGTTLAGDATSSGAGTAGAGDGGSGGIGTALAGGSSTSGGAGDGSSGAGAGTGDGDALAFGADGSGDGDGTSTAGGSATGSSGTAFAGADTSGDGRGEEGDDRNLTGGTGTVLAGGADGGNAGAAGTAGASGESTQGSGDGSGRSGERDGGGAGSGSEIRFVGGGETDSQAGSPIRVAQADSGDASMGSIQSPECAADRNQQVRTVSTNPGGGRPLVSVRGNGVRFSSHSCGSGPGAPRSR